MEISFKDILRIIKKNIVFIIIFSLVLSVFSFFVTSFFMKKSYTSSAKFFVATSYETSSGNEDLTQYNYASKLVATYIQLLDTNSFFSDVSEELDEKYTSTQLHSMVKFTTVENTEVFKGTVVCSSPTDAKRIADAIAKVAPQTIKNFLKNNSELKIVDQPTIPAKASSPNVQQNILVAFLIGLVISITISFVRDYFDVKIKYDESMTVLCDVPVLAAIPDFESFTDSRMKKRGYYGRKPEKEV